MEDRCIFCGADVSDLGIQVCPICLNERMENMTDKRIQYLKKQKERRKYQEWLNRRPNKWRIISYFK